MKNNLQIPSRQANKPFILSNWKSNEDIVCPRYKKNTELYIKKFRGAKGTIHKYFLERRHYKNGMKRSNRDIATVVGYSIRTIIRVTKQLHREGLIYKYHTGDRHKNIYYFHNLFMDGNSSFTLWNKLSLNSTQRDGYLEKGIAGIVRIPFQTVTLLRIKEDTMAKASNGSWDTLPKHVRNDVAMASAYEIPKVKRSSNRNDEGFELVVWNYGDKSADKISVEENIHPNGSCPLCFLCTKNLNECICSGNAKHDSLVEDKYIH